MDFSLIRQKITSLLMMKARFAMTGALATGLDYLVYLILVNRVFSPVISNLISYPCGVILNFALHRRFVFHMKGKPVRTFMFSILVSSGGLGLMPKAKQGIVVDESVQQILPMLPLPQNSPGVSP